MGCWESDWVSLSYRSGSRRICVQSGPAASANPAIGCSAVRCGLRRIPRKQWVTDWTAGLCSLARRHYKEPRRLRVRGIRVPGAGSGCRAIRCWAAPACSLYRAIQFRLIIIVRRTRRRLMTADHKTGAKARRDEPRLTGARDLEAFGIRSALRQASSGLRTNTTAMRLTLCRWWFKAARWKS